MAHLANLQVHALATIGVSGLLARTGAGTLAARTLTGTANQVALSNGDGVAGNPTFSTPQDIHTGASPTFNNLTLAGDLVVQGDSIIAQMESVLVEDNYIDMNHGYTADAAVKAGLTVRYDPTVTVDTVAAGGFTAATTVATTGAAVFAAGDIIAFDGATNPDNNGLYEVTSHVANVLTIDSTPTESFSKTGFTVSAGAVGTITKVNVAVLQWDTNGDPQIGKGSTVPIVYTALATTGASVVLRVTGTGTVTVQDVILADTDGGAYTYNLEAAPAGGRTVTLKNCGSAANNLTVGRNAINIEGLAADWILADGASATFVYNATEGWRII